MTAQESGRLGEDAVCAYLEQAGYKILSRNFRIRGGEIDIIALSPGEADTICFVEVKTRKMNALVTGTEAVNHRKQRFVIRTAHRFCEKCDFDPEEWYLRYDIASVTTCHQHVVGIEYLENAFDETDFQENR